MPPETPTAADLARTLREHHAAETPGEWKVKKLEPDNPETDLFVECPDPRKPYGYEIMGDEGYPTKGSDAAGIAWKHNNALALADRLDELQARAEAAERERDALIGEFQRLQPAGSPPPGGPVLLAQWIRVEQAKLVAALQERAEKAERERDELKEDYDEATTSLHSYMHIAEKAEARVAELEAELAEVKAGYDALDRNWSAIHEGAMGAIRKSLGNPDATVPEICATFEAAPVALTEGERLAVESLCLAVTTLICSPRVQHAPSCGWYDKPTWRGMEHESGECTCLLKEIADRIATLNKGRPARTEGASP